MRSRRSVQRSAVAAFTVALILSIDAAAGWGEPIGALRPGTRVRVETRRPSGAAHRPPDRRDGWDPFGSPYRITGTVSSVRNDTLFVVEEEGIRPLGIPFGELKAIEVPAPGNRATAGAALGFIVGSIAGGIIGHEMTTPKECTDFICIDVLPPDEVVAGIAVGGMTGALIGGILGSSIHAGHDWKKDSSVRLGPVFGGFPRPVAGVGFSARF